MQSSPIHCHIEWKSELLTSPVSFPTITPLTFWVSLFKNGNRSRVTSELSAAGVVRMLQERWYERGKREEELEKEVVEIKARLVALEEQRRLELQEQKARQKVCHTRAQEVHKLSSCEAYASLAVDATHHPHQACKGQHPGASVHGMK